MRIASSVPMQSEVPIENEIVAYVGLDWADQQHVICWQAAGSVDARGARRCLKPGAGPAGGASAATGESADQADPATAQPLESLFPPSPGLGRGARQPASL